MLFINSVNTTLIMNVMSPIGTSATLVFTIFCSRQGDWTLSF